MSEDYLSKPLSLGGGISSSSDFSSSTSPTISNEPKKIAPMSPYLNYDPRFLQQTQPEFIFPEGASRQRGRFELAFSQIGTSAMAGAGIGGVAGLYNGIKTTAALQQYGKLRRTQLLNHVMKQGSATASTLGTITVMYSAFGVFLQWIRDEEDEINTVLAGTATGLLYKSSAGLKKCALGGGIGLGITGLYCLFHFLRKDSNKFSSKSFL